MCTCNQTNPCNQTTNICGQTPCTPTQDCSCPVRLNSECVTYNGLDLECSRIESGLDLNQTLQLLDDYICTAIAEINNSINLINVGTGLQIYAGIDSLGRRKIRTLITTGNLLTSVQNTDDITIGINETELSQFVKDNQKTYSVDNVGTGATIYKDATVVGDNTQFNLKSLTSDDSSITISQNADSVDLSVNFPTETPTYIQEGTNVTVTGAGTLLDPYIINSTDTDTIIELSDGYSTSVTGTGTNVDPYLVNLENLQKTVNTFPYTLVNADDKQTIFVDNGASNVVINVPDGLVDNFTCCFIQKGTGTVTIQASGTATLLYPSSVLQNIIKGQYFWGMIEKEITTDSYYLLGSLLPV